MSHQAIGNRSATDDPAFIHLLRAGCSDMRVLNGRLEASICREGTCPEIQIAIPGERAIAQIAYRTAEGRILRQSMTDRQISIIPSNQPHQLFWQRRADLTMILITPESLKRIAHENAMRGIEVIGQYGAFDPVIWHLGRELGAELRRRRQLDNTYIQSAAIILTRHLVSTYLGVGRIPLETGGLPRFRLRRAVEYVQENIVEDISFRDVAAHLRMSAHHFARLFKQSTGESPQRYIARCKIERAKTLLSDARLPISDIAFEVGYKSQSAFTTRFGTLTGVTPGAFRAGRSI